MTTRALLVVAGLLGLGVSVSAQEMQAPELVPPSLLTLAQTSAGNAPDARATLLQPTSFAALNSVYYGPAPLTLADGRLFSFSRAFGWMEATPVDFLPYFVAAGPVMVPPFAVQPRESNVPGSLVPRFDYATGEVGVFYGRSTGKYSHEITQGYILGTVGNENTQITVGAAYGQSSGHLPALHR
jgi:hypothetical protein